MVYPNILFLVVDGFRSDKCFGPNKSSKTPNLDSIKKLGITFPNTSCVAYSTIPSMSCVFSSMYPYECVIEDNETHDLSPNVITYISHLAELGYNTYGFVPEVLNTTRIPQLFGKNVNIYPNSTISQGLGKEILAYFEKINSNKPWFFYLHLYDLYIDFISQNKPDTSNFLEDYELGNNRYERIVSNLDIFFGTLFDKIDFKTTILAIFSDHGNDRGAYDKDIEDFVSSLRKTDSPLLAKKESINKLTPGFLKSLKHNLGKKYVSHMRNEKIKNKIAKIDEDNLSIHKKRLINSSISGMTHLFDDRFRIPLILVAPQLNKPQKIENQITSIDIFPTIFDMIDHSEYNIDARGKTLLPLINEESTEDSYAFIDSIGNSPKTNSNLIGIRRLDYKYFRDKNDKTKSVSLYDLKKDPLEEKNIAQDNPDVIEKFEKIISNINPNEDFSLNRMNLKTKKESEDAKKLLKDLGYI